MSATVIPFPRPMRPAVLDGDVLLQRERILDRWCRHMLLNHQGMIDEVERDGGAVLAKMTDEHGRSDWFPAAHVMPASKGRPL